ncbi:hypothetical protein E2C01_101517 [Portunus trituberculatus]|uniref:Uncharacterized protein n=1 Tax=Portunus trituberculatus TaxID=210409 RepID=A0A5B7KM59_PORTR|nr:hypothetical protein [Portunus trituberculatus]
MDLSTVWPPGEEEGDIVKEVASEPAVSDSDTLSDVPRRALPPRRLGRTRHPPAWWRDFIHSDSDSDT